MRALKFSKVRLEDREWFFTRAELVCYWEIVLFGFSSRVTVIGYRRYEDQRREDRGYSFSLLISFYSFVE